MITRVYIDGFNLYFGAAKRWQCKWLNPVTSPPEMVRVIKTEEKGSDVNLASQLLNDAHQKRMECAVLVTGDSDLLMPVRIVKEELGLTVGVLNPQKHPCAVLKRHATFYKHLKRERTIASLLPDPLADIHGDFHKPKEWVTS